MGSIEAKRDPTADWISFSAEAIPSKGVKLPDLFWNTLQESENQLQRDEKCSILELGCGCGELANSLHRRGHRVTGVDVNEGGIAQARLSCPDATFLVRDVRSIEAIQKNQYELVILQLLLSIVGSLDDRRRTLEAAVLQLAPGGSLYLSCSGVSHEINENYRRLYLQDSSIIGENHSYFSRDATGRILYTTHHFEVEELQSLLVSVGLKDVCVEKVKETSSRRPDEAAYFLYATAKKTLES